MIYIISFIIPVICLAFGYFYAKQIYVNELNKATKEFDKKIENLTKINDKNNNSRYGLIEEIQSLKRENEKLSKSCSMLKELNSNYVKKLANSRHKNERLRDRLKNKKSLDNQRFSRITEDDF